MARDPNPIVRMVQPVTRLASILCGWWLLLISLFTCVEIIGRKLFSFSLQGVDEVGGYTLAVVASFGFAHALVTRAHTRIDFLIVKLSDGGRAFLNAAAMVTLALMAAFALWKGVPVLMESIEFKSRSTSPLQTVDSARAVGAGSGPVRRGRSGAWPACQPAVHAPRP
jgi:TRAP-type C4-dicarboxylate transport system permease small subunit